MTSKEVKVSSRTQARRRPNRAEKREANRQRILRAARDVFGKQGFHGATIEQIADEAGLSNGAIYYNFSSKGELFLKLLEERQDDRIEHMRATLSPATDGKALDRALVNEARDAIRSLKDSREWRLLVLEFIAYAVRTPNLAPKLKANERKLRDALTELMQQQIDVHGITSTLPAAEFALGVIALAEGLAVQELTDPGAVRDDLLPDLLTLLLPGPSEASS